MKPLSLLAFFTAILVADAGASVISTLAPNDPEAAVQWLIANSGNHLDFNRPRIDPLPAPYLEPEVSLQIAMDTLRLIVTSINEPLSDLCLYDELDGGTRELVFCMNLDPRARQGDDGEQIYLYVDRHLLTGVTASSLFNGPIHLEGEFFGRPPVSFSMQIQPIPEASGILLLAVSAGMLLARRRQAAGEIVLNFFRKAGQAPSL